MTRERLGKPRLRAFVALELPEEFRRRLVAWRDPVFSAADGFRLLAPENLHVTLVFLGYQYEKDLPTLEQALGPSPRSAFELQVAQLTSIGGGRDRGRAFALQMRDDQQLAGWQGGLVGRMAATGLHDPEQRPFWPHVTIVRSKAKQKLRAPEGAAGLPDELLEPFEAGHVTLFKSVLHPSGARYEPLGTIRT